MPVPPSRSATALHLVLMLVCLSAPAAAGDWPGWRGLERQGHGVGRAGPLQWSSSRSVAWRTAIPGEGHSSPIVAGDSVYLTTAREVRTPAGAVAATRYLLAALSLTLAGLGAAFVARRCAARGRAQPSLGSLVGLVGFSLGVTGLLALVFYGETALGFGWAVERPWVAACLAGLLALGLAGSHAGPLPRAAAGAGLLALSVVLWWTVPDPAHTIWADPWSDASVLVYAVVALPALVGVLLLAGAAGRRRPPAAWLLRGLSLAALAAAAAVLGLRLAAQQNATRATVSVAGLYRPALPLWVVCAAALLLGAVLLARGRRAGAAADLAVVVTGTFAAGLAAAALFEQAVARVRYLSYLVREPVVRPMLGWGWVAAAAAVAVAAGAGAAALAIRARAAPAERLGPGWAFRAATVALAALYLPYAVAMPRGPRLERAVVRVDRETGAIRWISRGLLGPRGTMHEDNSPATPTPATDGERIYAYFGSPGLLCVDTAGRWQWVNTHLPFESREGVASSPILVGGRVVVLSESDAGSYLAAVDCRTGRLAWRTDRGKKTHGYAGNCRTPLVVRSGGRAAVVVWGLEDVSGYDPATGRELWSYAIGDFGTGGNPVASMVSDGRRLYLVGPARTVALDVARLGGEGSPIAWDTVPTEGAQCASPVVVAGLLFAVSDPGTIYCIDTASGREVWSRRLDRQHYASVVALGGRACFCDTGGRATVVACEPGLRVLATNDLGERVFASFAPVDGAIYVRGRRHLFCLREP